MLLRGCILRNTKAAIGVVVYTGNDTKTMKNSGPTPFKRTQVDHKLDRLIGLIFISYVIICTICAVVARVWVGQFGADFRAAYNFDVLEDESSFQNKRFTNPDMIAFLLFWGCVLRACWRSAPNRVWALCGLLCFRVWHVI